MMQSKTLFLASFRILALVIEMSEVGDSRCVLTSLDHMSATALVAQDMTTVRTGSIIKSSCNKEPENS